VRGPTRLTTRLLEALGATAVGMPVPQVPEALSRNVVEGAVIPWEVTRVLRVPELVDTHTEFGGDHGLYSTFFFFAMNHDSYNDLPDDLKAIIDANSGIETSGWAGRAQEAADAAGRRKRSIAATPSSPWRATLCRPGTTPPRRCATNGSPRWRNADLDGAALIEAAEQLIAEETNR
jgi:TRAP-type transport system periplasmic protein